MGLATYRKGQGSIARSVSTICLIGLLFYGCYQLYGFLVGWAWGRDPLFEFVIPIVDQPFNVAIVAASGTCLVVGVFVLWFLNRKASVDLLVETETEMKKVSWPSWPETLNAAIVVIVAVAIIGVYLAVVDVLLGRLFGLIL